MRLLVVAAVVLAQEDIVISQLLLSHPSTAVLLLDTADSIIWSSPTSMLSELVPSSELTVITY